MVAVWRCWVGVASGWLWIGGGEEGVGVVAVSRFAAGMGVGQAGRCGLWPLGLKLLCLWPFSKKNSQKLGAKIV